jgi:hypothetical protein
MTHIKKKLQPLQHIHGIWKPHIIHISHVLFVVIKVLKEGKRKEKKVAKKREEERKLI